MFEVSSQTIVADSAFVPTPFVLTSKDQKTIVIAVSWGKAVVAQKIADQVLIEIERPATDEETVIRGSNLKSAHLKSILQKAHVDVLSANAKEFVEAIEMVIIHTNAGQVHIAQSGNSTVWGFSEKKWPVLLAAASVENHFSPLPENFLGTDSDSNIQVRQTAFDDLQEMVISSVPSFPKKAAAKLNLKKWADLFADEAGNRPFWLVKISKS